MRDFWFRRIGGHIDITTNPKTYTGGDISRINEVPAYWREQVRELIEAQEPKHMAGEVA